MNKAVIKSFAVEARKKLIASVKDKAGRIGITKENITEAIRKGEGYAVFPTHIGIETTVVEKELKQRENLVNRIKEKGYESIMEEVAYTWFNRIIAVRFMEVNDYLPSRIRVLSSETKGKFEPDIVTQAPKIDLGLTDQEIEEIISLKEKNELDKLFRNLFIKQCNELGEILPDLFENTSQFNEDYTEILLDISYTNEDGVISDLIKIDEEDFLEAVEIIGWMYQYYNTELKDETFALLKQNVKITKERIPSATQLFTPDWIVRYMVENSLGRLWLEGHPNDTLKAGWKYYLDEAEQETDVVVQLEKIRAEYRNINPEEIQVIDPCMGSGHILVYAFDILMRIYESCGYTQRDAASLVVEKNLYGLDIDDRAYQLAYFAVMMKGRKYDRRFLTKGINTNLYSIQESNTLISFEQGADQLDFDSLHKETANYLIKAFKDAKEYGSILDIEQRDYDGLLEYIQQLQQNGIEDLFVSMWLSNISAIMPALIRQAKIMLQKYDVVVTNPPYMGSSGMSTRISDYVKRYYPNNKSDLFAVFMEKCCEMTKSNKFTALVTSYTWMFLSSYTQVREKLINNFSIYSLVQPEYHAFFDEAYVPLCSFVLRNCKMDYVGEYIKLQDFYGADIQPIKMLQAVADPSCNYRFSTSQKNFSKIPGMPIAYWISEIFLNIFLNNNIYKYSVSASQNVTGNNALYLRFFWEVVSSEIGKDKKWIFYAKGGGYRKWIGNMKDVINWTPEAREIYRTGHASQIVPEEYWYKKGMTWGLITSNLPSFRLLPIDSTFDKGGSSIFIKDDTKFNYIFGLLNSKVFLTVAKVFNPTLNFQVKDIRSMPVIFAKQEMVDGIVESIVSTSQNDWDSFETSRNFNKHPLVENVESEIINDGLGKNNNSTLIKYAYEVWEKECYENFAQLKANEEELNRLFIEIYSLQDELIPEINDQDVTVRKADLQRDIRSFVSYAVGCMFGRYSLDVEGLAYAGGQWDDSKYTTFTPNKDNVMLIIDEEYFEDDIVSSFVKFVKVVFREDTLEENLDFIAEALGNKGSTSREIIRNYFLKDFYKDHVKTYQKRPIYWLFDSGKESGFKALIYLHRYSEDTVGLVRADYLHKTQAAIENSIVNCDVVLESNASAIDKAKAVKQKGILVKQLAETRLYDQAIAHIAHQRIPLDLDDGVVANYAKFQGIEVSSEGKKSLKVDLLGKI